jgi:hypothetical protein
VAILPTPTSHRLPNSGIGDELANDSTALVATFTTVLVNPEDSCGEGDDTRNGSDFGETMR